MKKTNNLKGKNKMRKYTKGYEVKVGDLIRIDSCQWSEYPQYCSGSKGIVVKLGTKYAKVECFARSGLINVEYDHFAHLSKDKLDEVESKFISNLYKRNNIEERS
jgi:hypothetical protein|tara:strand:- start:283 stop:597 length:315 start_codon:yes stop_codon:yes gene_type:complete